MVLREAVGREVRAHRELVELRVVPRVPRAYRVLMVLVARRVKAVPRAKVELRD